MKDLDTSVDSIKPRLSRFSPIAIALILIALVGACLSAGYSQTLSNLLREQRRLSKSFGAMDLEDPSQVAIVAVSPAASDLPPWVDSKNTWIYRIHIPANYGIAWTQNDDLIAAESPLHRGGSGSTYGTGDTEAKEVRVVITTIIEDGRLKGKMLTNLGSFTFSLPKKMATASLDELVLDEIVKTGEPMRTFTVDEAICVWRLRSKEPSKKMLNHTKLYRGCAIYLCETSKRDAFDLWASGKSLSMGDSTP